MGDAGFEVGGLVGGRVRGAGSGRGGSGRKRGFSSAGLGEFFNGLSEW